jgi:predicted TPR repeat methyltransferase/Flp pilus assembly protein TadD
LEAGLSLPFILPTLIEAEGAVAALRSLHQPFDRLLTQMPPEKALRHFGLALWQAGQADAAMHAFRAAIALAPEDAAIWSDLANLFFATGRLSEAQISVELSLSKNVAQPQAWLLLATILNGAHKYGEAEHAFRRALDYDPNLAEAAFGLGILFFQQRRFDDSVEYLNRASAAGCYNVGLYVCLGQALFLSGRFLEAAEAFARASQFEANDKAVLEKIALLQFIKAIIEGPVDAAIDIYRGLAGDAGEDLDSLINKVFHLLSGYGYIEAAIKLGRAWLARSPDDPVRRYMLAAVSGEVPDHAPQDYVVNYFNRFAEGFEHQLRRVLHYRVPEELHALLAARGQNFARILDLGCGTGLAAPFLKSFDGRLEGVDLAPLMLEKAQQRGVYDDLIEAEAVTFLAGKEASYDLIFAADSLIYFGDLSGLFAAAAKSLVAGGVFACSIETTLAADYKLQPTGRFAHAISYVEALAQPDFVIESKTEAIIRLEVNQPVQGALIILRRS